MKTGANKLLAALGAVLLLGPAWAASTGDRNGGGSGATLPEPPAPPAPPSPPDAPTPPEPPVIGHAGHAGHPGTERHRHIVRYNNRDGADHDRKDGEEECSDDALRAGANVVTEDDAGSQRTRILVCADKIKRETYAEVIAALREARDEIAHEGDLPERHRARALAELDREIARIERERGGE